MESRFFFGKVHIIEWLWKIHPETGRPERRTGHESYLELRKILAETGAPAQAIFHRVGTLAAFLARLERIEQDFRATGKIPLLQIETHGDDEGIGLTQENGLPWSELMQALTPLNIATGLRLPVVLASCHGIWGIKRAQPVERAPFLALLGPNREVKPSEVVRGMAAFYRGVFVHKDGDCATRMLNGAVDPDNVTFGIFNCEKLFTDVWNGYLEETAQPGVAEARVERMMETGRATYGPLPPAHAALTRRAMYEFITDQPARFNESWRHFFMVDLYPENGARFNLAIARVDAGPTMAEA